MMIESSMLISQAASWAIGPIAQAQNGAAAAGKAAGEAAAMASNTGMSGWLLFAIFVAIIGLPFLFGWLIAKALRLPDISTRVGVTILAATIGATPFAWSIFVGTTQQGLSVSESLRESFRLGVDLAGGTNLVYEVLETKDDPITAGVMDEMVSSIVRRINPSGTEEITVRVVGRNRIEIIVPGADPEKVRRIKDRVTKLGTLSFNLLANRTDHAQLIQRALSGETTGRLIREGSRVVAAWRDVARTADGEWKIQNAPAVRYIGANGEILDAPPEEALPGITKQVLVLVPPPDEQITGQDLESADATRDQSGRPAVAFQLYPAGGRKMYELTSSNTPSESGFERQMAIVLDGKVHSAPSIQEAFGPRGQITGRFTQQEVRELVSVLNAGALQAPLNPEPVSEYTISPLLGQDTINRAITAILWSGAAALLITGCYYLLAGLIADFCLMLNLLLLLGIMSMIDATFTLAGLAGIVLTFAMAVDANVLIFERMREEIDRGSSLRMAIRNGFDHALSAIVDSNVTTLITAVILYMIGTEGVKGFAVSLFIGIVVSMFTALYVSRLIFDVIDRKRWIRKLPMFAVLTDPHYDWLKHKVAIVGSSLLLLVIGVGVLFYRGRQMFDIDFLGGTMVTFQLNEPTTSGRIKEILSDVPAFEHNVSVERLVLMGEETKTQETGRRFRIRTTLQDADIEAKANEEAKNQEGAKAQEGESAQDADQGGGEDGDVTQLVANNLAEAGLQIRRVTIEVGEVVPLADKVENIEAEQFVDGYSAEITLQESADGVQQEFSTETVQMLLLNQLESFQMEGHEKYQEIGELVRVVGLAGSGASAGETEAKAFSHLRIDVAPQIAREDFTQALAMMKEHLATHPVFDQVNTFDSAVAGDTREAALIAIVASWLAMIGYLWFRFQEVSYGLAAVFGLIHDISITLGLLAICALLAGEFGISFLGLEEFKINMAMVAAVLTLIGYSVNDTIVVFDRIREIRGKNPNLSDQIVNDALNSTLSRTILTSVTTLIVSTILYFFGGSGIHGFMFILTLGIIVGTFSSIYVSSPILLWLIGRKRAKQQSTRPRRETVST